MRFFDSFSRGYADNWSFSAHSFYENQVTLKNIIGLKRSVEFGFLFDSLIAANCFRGS